MNTLNVNTTVTTSTVNTQAEELIAQGYAKSKEFSLIFTGLSVISDTASLKSIDANGADAGKYSLSAKIKLLKEQNAELTSIKKQVEAIFAKNGVRVDKQPGCYLVPNCLLKDILKELLTLKDNFDKEVDSIVANYDTIKNELEQTYNAIEDDDVRKQALAKIPTAEQFRERNTFMPNPFPAQGLEDADEELQKLVAQAKAQKAQSVAKSFLDKIFNPFHEILVDIDCAVRTKSNYKSDELGKKRTSMRNAIDAVMDSKTCLKMVFRQGEQYHSLVESAYDILEQVSDRFTSTPKYPNPEKGSAAEKEAVKVFYNVANTFKSLKDFEEFLANCGTAATLLGYFDIRTVRGQQPAEQAQVATVVAQPKPQAEVEMTQEEKEKNIQDALSILNTVLNPQEQQKQDVVTVVADNSQHVTTSNGVPSLADIFGSEALATPKELNVNNNVDDKSEVKVSISSDVPQVHQKIETAEDLYKSLGL